MDNRPLTLRQLRKTYGLSYERVRRMVRLPNFPIVEGVVFPKDFDDWRKEYYRNQHIVSVPPPDVDHKAGGSVLRSGLLASVRQGQALQLGAALLFL